MRYYHVRVKGEDDVPGDVTARTAPDPVLATAISVAGALGYHVSVTEDTLELRWPVHGALRIPLASLRDATGVPAGGPYDDQDGWNDLFNDLSTYLGGFTATAEGSTDTVRLADFAAGTRGRTRARVRRGRRERSSVDCIDGPLVSGRRGRPRS